MRFSAFAVLLAGIPTLTSAGPAAYPRPEGQQSPRAPSKHLRPVLEKRQQFAQGQPISADGKGAPILGV